MPIFIKGENFFTQRLKFLAILAVNKIIILITFRKKQLAIIFYQKLVNNLRSWQHCLEAGAEPAQAQDLTAAPRFSCHLLHQCIYGNK